MIGQRPSSVFATLASVCLLLVVGCAGDSDRPKQPDWSTTLQQLLEASPFSTTANQKAFDLAYCTTVFFQKEGRWPKDYAELRDFVDRSNGFLILGTYPGLEFAPKDPDRLEVSYGSNGVTNHMTLEPPKQK